MAAASVLVVCGAAAASASGKSRNELERGFRDVVIPFLNTYCFDCHSGERHKGGLDLGSYSTIREVARDYRRWDSVLEQLKESSMPPEKAKRHPRAALRSSIVAWMENMRREEWRRNAGDPGVVLARRLSNAEYDHTIRDLTGVDIRPAREFPVDPANESGFDNSGESLTMSPALLKKQLEAARHVAGHLVLKSEGFAFAPFPVLTDTDRDKYAVRRIIEFYQRQATNYSGYFMAAWKFKHRAALGRAGVTLSQIAKEEGISLRYLSTVWSVLTNKRERIGPIAALQELWRDLPKPGGAGREKVMVGCLRMGGFVNELRQQVKPEFDNLTVRGMNNGSQPLVLWKVRQYATNRMRYTGGALLLKTNLLDTNTPAGRAMVVPEEVSDRKAFEQAFERFCAIFPDAFYVSERARVYLDQAKEKENVPGRLLSAGFHSQMGYFRDDAPLYELILDGPQRRELDILWKDLDFITAAPMRQHRNFLWFERTDSRFMLGSEFEFARAEDHDSTSDAKIQQLAEVYVAKVRRSTSNELIIRVVEDHFENVSRNIRSVEHAKEAAEPSHLASLQAFAERAYRRPLPAAERDEVVRFYRQLRQDEKVTHEEAVRDTVVSVLMSPFFAYRIDLPSPGTGVRPLSDAALASRLSYFLWASMPDEELLAHVAAGDLHRRDVLAAQTRRMLKDGRARGLATEFGANWLDFRRFEEHAAVDRERFPSFNAELRQAMFEEPIRFFLDVARENRPVLDFLQARHTFVNPILAKHYGMPGLAGRGSNEWVRMDDAFRHGRGGLLPMSVFLTQNAPGLRTSPVKRGYWVARRLLGERIPPPPPSVPELPGDESQLGELTLRETLARHRADKSCSGCHERFDSLGLVFEGYGPIGESRSKDLGGRPVETHAVFPGGSEGTGLSGLRAYLLERRQAEFVRNLCGKMLAYALGRSLLLSDEPTIENMIGKLAANGYRFNTLIETIVTSPQFLSKRGQGGLASN